MPAAAKRQAPVKKNPPSAKKSKKRLPGVLDFVERDAEEEAAAMAAEGNNAVAPEDLPPQLMFVHQGMRDPKELRWHHQIPGMICTTALDGFNAFKAYNVGNEVA